MNDYSELKADAENGEFPKSVAKKILELISENERLDRESQNLSNQLGECDRDRRQLMADKVALVAAYTAAGEREHVLRVERETLRKAVVYAVDMFSRVSSGDGSGHADLGRAVLRIAGDAMGQESGQ